MVKTDWIILDLQKNNSADKYEHFLQGERNMNTQISSPFEDASNISFQFLHTSLTALPLSTSVHLHKYIALQHDANSLLGSFTVL